MSWAAGRCSERRPAIPTCQSDPGWMPCPTRVWDVKEPHPGDGVAGRSSTGPVDDSDGPRARFFNGPRLRPTRMSPELAEVDAVRPAGDRLQTRIRTPVGRAGTPGEVRMRFVGPDLHKKTLVVCALDRRGKV